MSLSIFNTLTRRVEPFSPLEPNHVRMYVCGMTVYDLCHLGHARSMVVFDMVQRWLKALGYRVTYVRNITDIDDKIIRRALEQGETISTLTERMIAAMHEDADRLGIERPTQEPRATHYVPTMIALIERLQARQLAYRSSSGDVNFAVRRFPAYGRLSGKSLDELRAGERVAVDDGKADPLDFVLWKAAKEHEPPQAQWESPFGRGRPGWHIECSAMSCALLGESFDIHGGGADLQFPHHDNEIAQSEGASGKTMAKVWMHNGFVHIDNEKMSKSLGNFSTIRDVLQRYDAQTLRFFLLRAHYRSGLNYSDVHLDDAQQALKRLYTALATALAGERTGPTASVDRSAAGADVDWSHPLAQRFRAAMSDDFNTPEAIAVLFEAASELNRKPHPAVATQLAALLRGLGGTLGLLQQNATEFLHGVDSTSSTIDTDWVEAQIQARALARQTRDFKEADRIRDQLAAQGVVLKDSAGETQWVRS